MGKWATLLWSGVAGALLSTGCVLPQEDDPLPELPPIKNRPPRILLDQVDPPLLIRNEIGTNCKKPSRCVSAMETGYACVQVEDPDVGDVLRVRWIVYDTDGTATQLPDPPQIPSTGSATRVVLAPNSQFISGIFANTGKDRRLQLFVADGEFKTAADDPMKLTTVPKATYQVRNPDGTTTTVNDLTYIDSYVWQVDTIADPCQ